MDVLMTFKSPDSDEVSVTVEHAAVSSRVVQALDNPEIESVTFTYTSGCTATFQVAPAPG